MKLVTRMIVAEPVTNCDIKAGTFTYLDPNGEECRADFYVHTCAEFDDDKRVNDYNEQYCIAYTQLMNSGCTRIRYEEDTKSLILG